MASSSFFNSPGMQSSKNVTTMVWHMTTMSRPYFAFVRTGQFQFLSLTYQSQFRTVRLQSKGIFMENWKMFSVWQGQCVALTWPLDRWIGNTSTNHPRTYLVLWHRHVMRGNWSYKKEGRQHRRNWQLNGGWAWFWRHSHGSRINLCTKREESGGLDACTDVQYACKDGWDKSDSEYLHEAFDLKCKHRCFLWIICIALTPWAWEIPLEGRKGGPQE